MNPNFAVRPLMAAMSEATLFSFGSATVNAPVLTTWFDLLNVALQRRLMPLSGSQANC